MSKLLILTVLSIWMEPYWRDSRVKKNQQTHGFIQFGSTRWAHYSTKLKFVRNWRSVLLLCNLILNFILNSMMFLSFIENWSTSVKSFEHFTCEKSCCAFTTIQIYWIAMDSFLNASYFGQLFILTCNETEKKIELNEKWWTHLICLNAFQ